MERIASEESLDLFELLSSLYHGDPRTHICNGNK